METILISILSSTFISAIVSGIITYYLKRLDFKNEYYKQIIAKRIDAYSYIEAQLAVLKSCVVDTKERNPNPYYLIFSYGHHKLVEFQQNLFIAISKNLWISKDTSDLLDELSRLFFKINIEIEQDKNNEEYIIEIGRKYYNQLAEIRNKLENSCRKDFNILYKMNFLNKDKKRKKQVIEI